MRCIFRSLAALFAVATIAIAISSAPKAAAQDDGGDLYTLGSAAAFCEPGYAGPFVGCSPWEGLTIRFVSSDGSVDTTCVTSAAEVAEPRAAGCSVDVPFGSTITASIDPAAIPAGYVLEGDFSVFFETPASPPTGLVGGPVFVLLPTGDDDGGSGSEDSGSDDVVESLPNTGVGAMAGTDVTIPLETLLLMLAVIVASAGMLTRIRDRN